MRTEIRTDVLKATAAYLWQHQLVNALEDCALNAYHAHPGLHRRRIGHVRNASEQEILES
jgi:hypothetical protein